MTELEYQLIDSQSFLFWCDDLDRRQKRTLSRLIKSGLARRKYPKSDPMVIEITAAGKKAWWGKYERRVCD